MSGASASGPLFVHALRVPATTGPRKLRTLRHPALDPRPPITRDVVPWCGPEGIVDARTYAAFLRHEREQATADEWCMLDDWGRVIDFDGAEFGDWIDPPAVPA